MTQLTKQLLLDTLPVVRIWSIDLLGNKSSRNFSIPAHTLRFRTDLITKWIAFPTQNPYAVYASVVMKENATFGIPGGLPKLESFIGFEILDFYAPKQTLYSNPTLDLFFLYDLKWMPLFASQAITTAYPDRIKENFNILETHLKDTYWLASHKVDWYKEYSSNAGRKKKQFYVRIFTNSAQDLFDEFIFGEYSVATEHSQISHYGSFDLLPLVGVHESTSNKTCKLINSNLRNYYWAFVLSIKKEKP